MPGFTRQGIVRLNNGHTLPGNIFALPNGSVRVTRGNSSVYFSKAEIHSINYKKNNTAATKENIKIFEQALKNMPSWNAAGDDSYDYLIYKASKKTNLDSALIKAVVEVESGFNPRGVSHKGAQGLMQLMPQTASSLGVEDAFNPKENIDGGSRYLRKMLNLFEGDIHLALAAYNAGPNAVKKYGNIPPYRETKQYVKKVLDCYENHKVTPRYYEYRDEKGCLFLSNYPKNRNYMPAYQYKTDR